MARTLLESQCYALSKRFRPSSPGEKILFLLEVPAHESDVPQLIGSAVRAAMRWDTAVFEPFPGLPIIGYVDFAVPYGISTAPGEFSRQVGEIYVRICRGGLEHIAQYVDTILELDSCGILQRRVNSFGEHQLRIPATNIVGYTLPAGISPEAVGFEPDPNWPPTAAVLEFMNRHAGAMRPDNEWHGTRTTRSDDLMSIQTVPCAGSYAFRDLEKVMKSPVIHF